jgi:hypothetical protein
MPDRSLLASDLAAAAEIPLSVIGDGSRVNQSRTKVASAKLSFSYFRSLILLMAFMCFLQCDISRQKFK